MTMKKVVVRNGEVINIGDWDEKIQSVEVGTDDQGQPIYEDRPTNPLPEGAEIVEMEVVQSADGGWVPVTDYAALRRSAYPAYSQWDVIDEILKHIVPEPGSRLEQMQAERLAVKKQYPKEREE